MHCIIVTSFAGLGCASLSKTWVELLWFASAVALSSQSNIVIVTSFMHTSWLDQEGCCVQRSHSRGSVLEPKLLWAVTQNGCVRLICFPFSFLVHSFLVPTSFSQSSVKPSCLIAVIACWTCTMNCSGVLFDHADTHNSSLPSRVSLII